jgi:hypothetical protein
MRIFIYRLKPKAWGGGVYNYRKLEIDTVTCLTEGNDRIRDTVAPFPVTVTIGLHGYEANNGMWGYVATDESALEVSLRQLIFGVSLLQ